MKQKNIAIVGAGLVGRLLALSLLKKNYKITIYDKDSKDGKNSAGYTAAGMLAFFAELQTAESIIFDIGIRSKELWKDILKELDIYDYFQEKGSIITAHPQDMSELEHFINTLRSKKDEAKDIKMIDSNELKNLEPDLAQHNKGYFIQNEAQVDSQKFIDFTSNYLSNHKNITFKEFTKVSKLKAKEVYINEKIEEFDWVFDARGLGAKEYFSDLRGVRGEVYWLESYELNITRPTRLLHPRYKIYIVPRNTKNKDEKIKRYIVGASEIESEDNSAVSVRSTLELMSAVFATHPSFGEARIVNTQTNCRPAFKNNLPKIENENGITRINGLYRHGYLLAPALVEQALNEGLYNDKS